MSRQYSSLIPAVATLFAISLSTACSSGSDSPTGVVEPPPVSDTRLQLDFTYIEAIKDCDGIEGDGDFSFKVTTNVSSGGGGTVYSGSRTLGNGARTGSLGRKTYTVPATTGQQVTVEFVASEVDKNIVGQTYNDSRLNGARRSLAHQFNNGTWSALGPRSIELGSGDCRVRLSYTANAL